ncbi:hypothetical protein ACRRTK_003059 [Alexandromys fortis]
MACPQGLAAFCSEAGRWAEQGAWLKLGAMGQLLMSKHSRQSLIYHHLLSELLSIFPGTM